MKKTDRSGEVKLKFTDSYYHAIIKGYIFIHKMTLPVLLIMSILFVSCSDKTLKYTTGTQVILQDSTTLTITVEFSFENDAGLREFKMKEQEVLFAMRLSIRQYGSSTLKGKGKRNVLNAIKCICKRRLDSTISRVKIVNYEIKG